jgi:hypothetical protein
LPPGPGQRKQQHPPDIYPPPERKYENLSLLIGMQLPEKYKENFDVLRLNTLKFLEFIKRSA